MAAPGRSLLSCHPGRVGRLIATRRSLSHRAREWSRGAHSGCRARGGHSEPSGWRGGEMTEQLLAIWVESLAIEQPDGSTLRETSELLDALEAMCPFTEVIRLGLYVLPLRGPSRFFGGDDVVLRMVRQCVLDVVGAEPKLGVAEGLFCAELAAHREIVVPRGGSDVFRRSQPLEVLGRKDLTTTCQRL